MTGPLIELEGLRESVEEQVEQIREVCLLSSAREFRVARSAEERHLLWKGRKNAFDAVGRVSPTLLCQGGVAPHTEIAPTPQWIGRVGEKVRPHHARGGGYSDTLHFGGWIDHRRAWRRHGEE